MHLVSLAFPERQGAGWVMALYTAQQSFKPTHSQERQHYKGSIFNLSFKFSTNKQLQFRFTGFRFSFTEAKTVSQKNHLRDISNCQNEQVRFEHQTCGSMALPNGQTLKYASLLPWLYCACLCMDLELKKRFPQFASVHL